MLTSGALTATQILETQVPSGTAPVSFTLPAPWGRFVQSNKLVLAFTGTTPVSPDTNSNAGFRISLATTPALTFTPINTNQVPGISAQPQSLLACSTASASLTVTALGTSPLAYQWRKNGSPLEMATNSALTLANLSSSDAGSYDVVVTNLYGAVTSSVAMLSVVAALPVSILIQPASQSVPIGANVAFGVTAGSGFPVAYQWYKGGNAIPNATNALLSLYSVTATEAGDYAVAVYNSCSSIGSQTATLTIQTPGSNGVAASTWATIRSDTNTLNDINEAALGYVMVKYSTNITTVATNPTAGAAKAYFQFDLAGKNPDPSISASLTVYRPSTSGQQNVQIWGLNQPYPGMAGTLTWPVAQANDTNSNNLLTGPGNPFAASAITNLLLPDGSGAYSIPLPTPWGQFIQDNKLVLALTGAAPGTATNSAAGFRIVVTNAAQLPTLAFSTASAAPPLVPPQLAGAVSAINGAFQLAFTNVPRANFVVFCSTNVALPPEFWTPLATVAETAPGQYQWTDLQATNSPVRFYRVGTP